jgi:ribosomal protein S25
LKNKTKSQAQFTKKRSLDENSKHRTEQLQAGPIVGEKTYKKILEELEELRRNWR